MRVLWVGCILLFAGCLDFDYDDGSPYGDFDLEGHAIGGSIWAAQAKAVVWGAPVAEPASTELVASPGMGDLHMLVLPPEPLEVEVRAIASQQGSLEWFAHQLDRDAGERRPAVLHARQVGEAQATTAGNGTARLSLSGPGLWGIVAQGDAGRSTPFYVAVDAAWDVAGEVYPQRANGQAPPQDYDKMADRYVVTLPTSMKGVRMQSFYAGDDGMLGTGLLVGDDVDIGLWGADGTPIVCQGSSDALGRANEFLEQLVQDVTVYDIAFAIGAMPDGCSGSSGWYYENQRPVPYTATLQTGYSLLLDG